MIGKRNSRELLKIVGIAIVFFILYTLYKLATKPTKKRWTPEQIELAKKHGLITSDRNQWTEQQKAKAQKLGLNTEDAWTPEEYNKAEEAGLLSHSPGWSPTQVKMARELGLIENMKCLSYTCDQKYDYEY